MTIILTERERQVFAWLADELHNTDIGILRILANSIRRSLGPVATPAESASPPRVPGASAHPLWVGVESGPGQPMNPAMGHLQNIASAAKANKAATELPYGWRMAWESIETQANAAIRALADAPTPDPLSVQTKVGYFVTGPGGRLVFVDTDTDPREIHDNGRPVYRAYAEIAARGGTKGG